MNLYNELVNIIINILFTDTNGALIITEWQRQVVEFVALPIVLILLFCFIGLLWKVLTAPFYFFKR